MVKRKRQRIESLLDDSGRLVTDQEKLSQLASTFYANLFSVEPTYEASGYISGRFSPLSETDCDLLKKLPSLEEVREAVFSMGALKAPGPDGLHALFYQSQWETLHGNLLDWIQKVFRGEASIAMVNETFLCLIPKVAHPTHLKQFRPIGLCNVTYKIITKILVQRLKSLMPKLVSQEQTSFVPGRHITNNILIAQETLHSFHTKKGQAGFMAIKVDLEKAYDRVSWSFLQNTLQDIGIPDMCLQLIMQCVTTSSMRVLWNGNPTNSFSPHRGVRQGDPLSPYLFVLCLERLSHKISQLVAEGTWKPMKFGRGGTMVSHLFFADDMLLLAEASQKQAELIKAVLQEFCDFSGQKVNASKTRVLFSRNISVANQNFLSQCMGFIKTDDLGKYLGMPLIQGRVSRATYDNLRAKVESRISGWKANKLSLAGRVTLAKSVLAAIPSFAMQTTKIPTGLCDVIDRRIRQFVWGSSEGESKVHLVAWHKICLPKEYGGLGFRSLRQQNEAYLMKLAWSIMTKPAELWVQVIRAKYGKSPWSRAEVKLKGNVSYQWRSILSVWDKTQQGLRWRLGNGESVSFWHDNWLDIGLPLSHLVSDEILAASAEVTVAQIVTESGNWRWDALPPLPAEVYMLITAMRAPSPMGPPDQIAWGPSTTGIFTLSSAFNLIHPAVGDAQKLWKLIWRWNGPQRIKSFLWLCGHNALLTNDRRCRMGMTDDTRCPRCYSGNETILHVLRDCFFIKSIWKQIIDPGDWEQFFRCSLQDWLLLILCMNLGQHVCDDWKILGGITVWFAWKWRNSWVFNGQAQDGDAPLSTIFHFTRDVERANMTKLELHKQGRNSGALIGWKLPDQDWIKLNSDGACDRGSMAAAAGGLFRDSLGNWLRGYVHHIGFCSPDLAELWGAIDGLELAWKLGYRNIILEMDSLSLVNLLQQHSTRTLDTGMEVLVTAIHAICRRDWMVRICHIPREGNCCADWLARFAFRFHLGFHQLEEAPPEMHSLLLSDIVGIRWPRDN